MSRIHAFVVAVVILTATDSIQAGIIRLDLTSGGLGSLLDEIRPGDVGTGRAGPFAVPGSASLSISVVGLSADGDGEKLNSTATSLGINAGGTDQNDRFESILNEAVSLRFDQPVLVSQLDFRFFDTGEVFEFSGIEIGYNDLSNKLTDVFDFATPLVISANTSFTLRATSGTIGIEAMDVSPQVATVPEPSSMAMFTILGLGLLARRRMVT